MRRLTALLLVTLATSAGCFVMDELDQSAELIEGQHGGPAGRDVAAAPPERSLRDRATDTVDELGAWWAELGAPEPSSDPAVDCHLHGKRTFTTESECLAGGGWVRP